MGTNENQASRRKENNLNVKYVIRNNKVIESTNQPFRYGAQELWD